MMPIFRIASRVSNVSSKSVFARSPVSHLSVQRMSSVSGQPDSVEDDIVWNRNRSFVEGFQGEILAFSPSEARRVMTVATEYRAEGPSIQGVQELDSSSTLTDEGASRHLEFDSVARQDARSSVYSGFDSHVDLNSIMQDSVRHPQIFRSVSGNGSNNRIFDKYASASMQSWRPSRHFSTSWRAASSYQGTTLVDHDEDELMSDPSPQGIQGDNCVDFKLWMENCQRYNLPNCDEQLESIKAGRKTLAAVFLEQQEIIRRVAESYKKQQLTSRQSDSSAQGPQDSSYSFEFSLDGPCPQGFQGEDCADYKIWAYNCHLFGFGDCSEKASDIAHGRRTLEDVFTEQDILIRKIVNDFKQKRNFSTSSGNSERA